MLILAVPHASQKCFVLLLLRKRHLGQSATIILIGMSGEVYNGTASIMNQNCDILINLNVFVL